jgi:hypothetical protein
MCHRLRRFRFRRRHLLLRRRLRFPYRRYHHRTPSRASCSSGTPSAPSILDTPRTHQSLSLPSAPPPRRARRRAWRGPGAPSAWAASESCTVGRPPFLPSWDTSVNRSGCLPCLATCFAFNGSSSLLFFFVCRGSTVKQKFECTGHRNVKLDLTRPTHVAKRKRCSCGATRFWRRDVSRGVCLCARAEGSKSQKPDVFQIFLGCEYERWLTACP